VTVNPGSFAPESLPPELQAFLAGFPISLLHAGVMLVLLFLGGVLYALITPYKEISQIREGNAAAAVAFGGVIVGLAIPLAAALSASNSLREIAIWGAATVVVQLFVFRLTDLVLMGLPGRVQEGEVSAAVLLTAAKLSTALVLAAAVSG
jgi:putative membrane protein